jgi:ABC-type transporter Mla subunit MlaD
MFIDVTLSAGTARSLEALEEAEGLLHDLHGRLGDLGARVAPVVAEADWRAPSARACHERLERWRTTLITAQGRIDDLADSVARARADLQARAAAALP